jgi:hypothetical protein
MRGKWFVGFSVGAGRAMEMAARARLMQWRCYVKLREYQASVAGVNQVIYDCLSPYFVGYNVKEFFDDGVGGEFGDIVFTSSIGHARARPKNLTRPHGRPSRSD